MKRKRKPHQCVKIWVSGARQSRHLFIGSSRLVGGMLRHAGLRGHPVLVVTALLDIVLICQSLLGIHLDVGHVRWQMRVLRDAGPARLGRQMGRGVLWGVDLVIVHAILVAVAGLGRV